MTISQPLLGSFPLTAEAVAAHAPAAGAGVFTLGFATAAVFTVQRVGRADEDVRAALLAHAKAGRYLHFKVAPAASAEDAFARECALFHDFGGLRHLDNETHPERPAGAAWKCPHCAVYGLRDWALAAR